MQEYTETKDNSIEFKTSTKPGENIRRKGEEFRKGQTVIQKDTLITPPVIGLLANLGVASAWAYRKPKVTLISTGNELIAPGKPLKSGQIYDSNTYAMAAALKAISIEQVSILHAKDTHAATVKAFSKALADSDMIISLGGISVGAFDFVKDVAEGLGIETLFWRISIKPGKPVYFGRKSKKIIFGLPGNPVSALVTYHQLVQPALLKMMGHTEATHELRAQLTHPLKKKAGRQEFVRGILTTRNGRYEVTPTIGQDSHMLGGLAAANCLIHFPSDSEKLEPGATVHLERLSWNPPVEG